MAKNAKHNSRISSLCKQSNDCVACVASPPNGLNASKGNCKSDRGNAPSAGAAVVPCCCPLVPAVAPPAALVNRSSSFASSPSLLFLFVSSSFDKHASNIIPLLFPIGGIFKAWSSLQFFVGNTLATSFAQTLRNASPTHLHHADVFVFINGACDFVFAFVRGPAAFPLIDVFRADALPARSNTLVFFVLLFFDDW